MVRHGHRLVNSKRWWLSARAGPRGPYRTRCYSFGCYIYQRTGPEGRPGPWLLLTSRVAHQSINVRYGLSDVRQLVSALRVLSEAGLRVSERECVLWPPAPSVTTSYVSVFCSIPENHLFIPFPYCISSKPAHSQRPAVEVEIHQSHIRLHPHGGVGCYICTCIPRVMDGYVGGP